MSNTETIPQEETKQRYPWTDTIDGFTTQFSAVVAQKIPRSTTRWGMKLVTDHPEIAATLLAGFAQLRPFEIFGSIVIGAETLAQMRQKVVIAKKTISNSANEILELSRWPRSMMPCRIVATNIGQLGFITPIGRRAVCERARMLGLGMCYAAVGAKVLVRMNKKDEDVLIHIMTPPVLCSSDGRKRTLVLENGTLDTRLAEGDELFDEDDVLVFSVIADTYIQQTPDNAISA